MRIMLGKLAALGGVLGFTLSGCSNIGSSLLPHVGAPATVAKASPVQLDLLSLPAPAQPIPIAVYGFSDQTGQLKPGENIQSLSRAVTQGGASILMEALRSAGSGRWFTVLERERLDNLLRERQIIREMRAQYLGEERTPAEVLPSLVFAGVTLEGGIIGFDSNVQTGGVGARLLGIGGSTQYRTNRVAVYLRAVSVRTGEVVANVVTEKKISSVALSTGAFRFVSFDKLLEAEVGTTENEPVQLAVQSAIERAVYALILEGAQSGPRQLWQFSDPVAAEPWLQRYQEERRKAGYPLAAQPATAANPR